MHQLDEANSALEDATQIAMNQLEYKYEDRLNLIRKMHDEEVRQIRQINETREQELE